MQPPISIEPLGHATHGRCPHCGGIEQSVWGWVHRGDGTAAVYYIRWTVNRPNHDLIWLVCRGPWHEGSDEARRQSVGLRLRRIDGQPQFMVVDAAETPWGCDPGPTLGRLMTREEVIGTPLATFVFAYVDAVLEQDARVARFVATGEGVDGEGTACQQ